jgi:hypothetical protein
LKGSTTWHLSLHSCAPSTSPSSSSSTSSTSSSSSSSCLHPPLHAHTPADASGHKSRSYRSESVFSSKPYSF